MNEVHQKFVEKIAKSIDNHRFVKLTLSKPSTKQSELRNIYARIVELKKQNALSFTLRYQTKDETHNYPIQEGIDKVDNWLGNDFLNADLFTLDEDISLFYSKKRKPRIFTKKPSHKDLLPVQHDKEKKRWINTGNNIYLQEAGIIDQNGKILKRGQKKFRQINKYIEIINNLIEQNPLPPNPSIVDMGSGKGYLTFALYDYLNNQMNLKATITGIELRSQLVQFCNRLAVKANFAQLSFLAQDIFSFPAKDIDMLIALHACDTATDMAIAKGIQSNATIIVVAPCCHKQIRQQMNCKTDLQAVLRHGILEERQAELITDGIRSLILEAHGYQTKVFEFISTEHTSKNIMIVGTKNKTNPKALEKVNAIKKQFGIEYHYLEKLLE